MSDSLSQYEIPRNSISCYIGRISETPSEDFASNGILIVDIGNVESDDDDGNVENEGPDYTENGTTKLTAIASWTLRSAYIAWSTPPKIKFKGNVKLHGKVSMNNAQLSSVNISGGPPMQGTITSPSGPGTSTTPVSISSASGTAKIEQSSDAEIEMETGDDLTIELTSQLGAQLPWCVNPTKAQEGDDIDDGLPFIKKGDKALCLAFGNSLSNLFVVDIFR